MTPLRLGQILLALHLACWRVTVSRRGTGARVTLTPPVSWDGERYTFNGATIASALSEAWGLARDIDPGPAQRMREIGGEP